jgi:endogenous inhibitor of DNA gyrase (YacG/DUF329 family)
VQDLALVLGKVRQEGFSPLPGVLATTTGQGRRITVKCPMCSRRVKKTEMNHHLQHVHARCGFCGRYVLRADLEDHMRSAHRRCPANWSHTRRRLLAGSGIPSVDDEGELPWDYEETLDARRREAIRELTSLIRRRYPTATFAVAPDPDDSDITILWTTIDVDDPDDVVEWVIERELQLQIEEGVPVYVVPIRTPERRAKLWQV